MDVLDLFADPDVVGEAEYRAIYDLLSDVLADSKPEERTADCRSVLNQLIESAEEMIRIIDKNTKENGGE